MTYQDIVKDPLIVAALAALIGLFFGHLYGLWKDRTRRIKGLLVLRHQLERQEVQLRELRQKLGQGQVVTGLDSTAIRNFLTSEIVDLSNDAELVSALYQHLDNIFLIDRALDVIAMRLAGFTTVQKEQGEALEENLRKAIEDCLNELYPCINLLPSGSA